jgi:four helix bundle protein
VPIASYRDLQVYRRSLDVLVALQVVLGKLPRYELMELASQMRRASKSVPLNIAEGYGRKKSDKDFKSFLGNAMGSANEMVVCLEICKVLSYVEASGCDLLIAQYDEIGRMLNGLIQKWVGPV